MITRTNITQKVPIGPLLVDVVTSHIYPPVPDRSWDWSAHYANHDDPEHRNYGWGPTAADAILSLLNQYDYDPSGKYEG
jgi:hypothetical protein